MAPLVQHRVVTERLLDPGLIPKLAMCSCVLGKVFSRLFSLEPSCLTRSRGPACQKTCKQHPRKGAWCWCGWTDAEYLL